MNSKIIRIIALIMLFALLSGIGVSAAEMPYHSYTYWLGYDKKTLVETKDMFKVDRIITADDLSLSDFSHPTAMAIDTEENLYIIEESVSRLTVVDEDLNTKAIISEFKDPENNSYTFAGASDICVTEDGKIYIADTINARVLVGDLSGNLINTIEAPASEVVPEDFIFSPIKVSVDSKGYVYVLSTGSTYGAVLYNEEGVFQSFYGANSVKNSVLNVFGRIWDMWFMGDEQRAGQVQKIPYQFNDICIDNEDFVYTITGALSEDELVQTGQIRCLSASGKNILKVKKNTKYVDSDSFNFGDEATFDKPGDFRYIQLDEYGYIYALDITSGRIFVYDRECNLLCAFAGGGGFGEQKGTFQGPRAMAVGGKSVYVADYSTSAITKFRATEYGTLVKQAQSFFLNGQYEKAKPLFEQILTLDKNSQLAYRGLAKAYLLNGQNEKALQMAEKGLDYNTYSTAFERTFSDTMKQSFTLAVIIGIFLVAAIIAIVIVMRKKNISINVPYRLQVYLGGFVHPFKTANDIKNKNGGSLILAVVTLVAFALFKILEDTAGGFLYNRFDRNTYNSIYTVLGTAGIVILWTICFWAMSVIFNGKSRIREVFTVSAYAMLPQIINSIFFLIVSNVFAASAQGILTTFSVVMLILSGIMLVVGCMVISEFDLFKMLGTSVLAIVAMGVVIFLIFMILILDRQLIDFIRTLYYEIRCKF